jgi:hypothetical protein
MQVVLLLVHSHQAIVVPELGSVEVVAVHLMFQSVYFLLAYSQREKVAAAETL